MTGPGAIDLRSHHLLLLLLSFLFSTLSDRRRDGKLVAVDLLHLHGHTRRFLRDEPDSRCTVRVSMSERHVKSVIVG